MSSIITPTTFVRVSKEPLDIYEKFNSIPEAKLYAQNGPAYNGQRIIVKMDKHPLADNEPPYMLCEIVNNKLRIINFLSNGSSFEPIIVNRSGGTNSGTWLLIFSYNPSCVYNETKYFNYNTVSLSLDNVFKYSIAGCCELFRNNDGGFKYRKMAYTTNETTYDIIINSDYNIITFANKDGEITESDIENTLCIPGIIAPIEGSQLELYKREIYIDISEFI